MKREDQLHDADRLAWLDAHRSYIEVGKTGEPRSGYVNFNGEAWQAYVKLADGHAYSAVAPEPFSTQREAIDALMEALS